MTELVNRFNIEAKSKKTKCQKCYESGKKTMSLLLKYSTVPVVGLEKREQA